MTGSIQEAQMWRDYYRYTYVPNGELIKLPPERLPISIPLCEEEFININRKMRMSTQTPLQYAEAKDLSKDERLLREMGLKDSAGKYTQAYNDLRRYEANKKFEIEAIIIAKEIKSKQKEEAETEE